MNRYRNLLPVLINGEYGQGDEFEIEMPEDEEEMHVNGGLLEILPQEYKVVGESNVFETAPGDTFTKALTLGQERLLVDGGFIERVEKTQEAGTGVTPKPRTRKKKE